MWFSAKRCSTPFINESACHLAFHKAHGTANPADMLTKALGIAILQKHITCSNLRVTSGRADAALDVE